MLAVAVVATVALPSTETLGANPQGRATDASRETPP